MQDFAKENIPEVRHVVSGSGRGKLYVLLNPDVYIMADEAKEIARKLIRASGARGYRYVGVNKADPYIVIARKGVVMEDSEIHPELTCDIQSRIARLQRELDSEEDSLEYADGGAYSQSRDRIADLKSQIAKLKKELGGETTLTNEMTGDMHPEITCDRCGFTSRQEDYFDIEGDEILCYRCRRGIASEAMKKRSRSRRNSNDAAKGWFGIKDAKFIYHGDWNDPEVVYKGVSLNYWDIESGLLEVYRDEHPEDRNDKGFDKWMAAHP